ncbi:protein SIEVE ELEMENT OCCLUSION B [Sesamum alatum]|uniref:Protein SIEVE ELEMENT OCCLUSION B n=1 Tax=Sesamum alatum TaxID=300844 RepID=A0AAE2C8S9_9LAMI|nr:protein SIEVE ELEMENT OCCLUSION B [Sesamum alatum]
MIKDSGGSAVSWWSFTAEVQETHSPDGRYVDCKPILKIAEEILDLAMAAEAKHIGATSTDTLEGTPATEQEQHEQHGDSDLFKGLSNIIKRLANEILRSGGVEVHSTTISLLKSLSSYSWDAKLVLSLAAVALNYGEHLLLTELYLSNNLPEPMAILKGMVDIRQCSDILKPRVSALDSLIKSMMDLAKCVVEFNGLLSASSSLDVKASSVATDAIVTATYWTIRVAVASANISQLNTEIGLEKISTTELWALSTLEHKLGSMKKHLENQLPFFRSHIEEKRQRDAYDTLVFLTRVQPIDSLELLKVLLCPNEEEQPLYDASNKTTVKLDVLRNKTVLLLISGLNIDKDQDFVILSDTYKESRMQETSAGNQYEVVWVPIVAPSDEWTPDMEKMLEDNRSTMPWYSVNHPNKIDPLVVKLIREQYHYQDQPIIVVLNRQGMVVNTNAIDMIWIWGNHGFPFSQAIEEALWKDGVSGLELIVNGFHHEIENWVKEGKYVVLYGGDDVEWIRSFVSTTRQVKEAGHVPLEMLYAGRSNQKEQDMNNLINLILKEKLGEILGDAKIISHFWNRIEHMQRSKIRLGSSKVGEDQDPVLQDITKLLSYDQLMGRWATLFKGNEQVLTGYGNIMLPTMRRCIDALKENANKEFDVTFKECFNSSQVVDTPPLRLVLPSGFERNISAVLCIECSRVMEKYILFSCDHGKQ